MAEPPAKRQHTDGRVARIAVAGCGWWGQGWHLPHLQRNRGSEISAVIEPCQNPRSTLNPDMKTPKELSEFYGVPAFSNIDDFLASPAAKNSDGIIIVSNHAAHHDAGMKCMAAGLHVLMDKPMCTDPQEALELCAEASKCQKNGKIFMVNNTANFREYAKKAHDLLEAGEIGTIKHVKCYMGTALKWLLDDPSNVGWVKPSGKMLGNGFGWGQMSHTFAWVYMVTGLVPEKVFCTMVYSETTGADMFDSIVIRCTNGATINAMGSGELPFKSHAESSKQIENQIWGTKGMLTYSGLDFHPESGDMIIKKHDGTETKYPGFHFENYESKGDGPQSLQAFIAGCRGYEYFNGCDATIGLRAVQTIEAMYRSAKSEAFERVVSK